MGKDHKGHRTKGSAKPSSSSRIATLLTDEAKNLSTSGGNAFLQAQAQFNEDYTMDPETRLTLKKLAKKDAVTKIKALEQLIETAKQDESLPGILLGYYVKIYPKLSQDEHRKVRELGNVLLGVIGMAVGRDLAPYLKSLMPFLVFAICDSYATVSSTATTAFQAIFPEHKKQKSLKFAQEEIESTITSTIQQVDTSKIEEENADFRMIYSSLKAVLYLCDNEVMDNDAIGELMKIPRFLDIVKTFRGGPACQLRRLVYDIISRTTPPKKIIEECLKKETSVEAIPSLWNCFLALSVSGSFDPEFIKRHLLDCCENGLYGSDSLGLGVLPVVAYVQQEEFSISVIEALISGYNKTRNRRMLRVVIEIFSYLTTTSPQDSLYEALLFPFIVSANFSTELATAVSQLIKSEYFYINLPTFLAEDINSFNSVSFAQFVCGILNPKKSVSFSSGKSKEAEQYKQQFLTDVCKIAINTKSYEFLKIITRKFCTNEFWKEIEPFDCNVLSINLDMLKFFPEKIEKVKNALIMAEFSAFASEMVKFEQFPVVLEFYHSEDFIRRLIGHCSKETVDLKFVLRPVFEFVMDDILTALLERDDVVYRELPYYDIDTTRIRVKLTRDYIQSRLRGEEVEAEILLSPEKNFEVLSEFILRDSEAIFKIATALDIKTKDVDNYHVDETLYCCYGLSPMIITGGSLLKTDVNEDQLTRSVRHSILYCKWSLYKDENLDKSLKYLMEAMALVKFGSRLNFDLEVCSEELDRIWEKIKNISIMDIIDMDKLPTRILRNKLKVGSSLAVDFSVQDPDFVVKSQKLLDKIFMNYGDYSQITDWLMTERKAHPDDFQFELLYKDVKDKEKLVAIVRLVEFLVDKCDEEFISTSACWISSYLQNCKTVTTASLKLTTFLTRVVTKYEILSKLNNWKEFEEFFAAKFYPVIYSQFFQLLEMQRDFNVRAALYCIAECLSGIPLPTLAFIQPNSTILVDEFGRLVGENEIFIKACSYQVLKKVKNASDELQIVPRPFITLFTNQNQSDVLSYYLGWDALLTIQSSSIEFANYVKQPHLLPRLLNSLFFTTLTMTNDYLKQYFEVELNLKAVNLVHLACHLLQKTMRTLPYTVRWWWNSELTKQRDKVHVDKFVTKFLSAKLAAEELGRVQWQKELDNVEINCHPGCNELIARYKIEETTVSLTISLPLNHPLGPVFVKISDKNLHARISHLLNSRSHSLAAGLKLWKENLDGVYKDVDECAICFFILHHVTKNVPKLACRTCKKKFHAACLYKWFSTSNKSECPLCRNLF